MRRTVSRRRLQGHSLHRLCQDVSLVINRVRAAFGTIPMKAVADRPEIKAAEATIELAARQVQNGAEGAEVWRGALIVYEASWMAALRDLQRADKSAA